MYFVRYGPLKQKLRSRSLSDREALPYFILVNACLTLAGAIATEGWNAFDTLSMWLSIFFVIGGTCYVYQQNGGKEGFDLIQKYVVLGWVLGFRMFLVLFVPLIILVILVFNVFLGEEFDLGPVPTEATDVLILVIIEVFFYQRLGRHIRDTKNIPIEHAV